MSINLKNPKTLLEKADAASNFVQQMFLAHMVKDESKFKEAHKKAGDLLFDIVQSSGITELESVDKIDELYSPVEFAEWLKEYYGYSQKDKGWVNLCDLHSEEILTTAELYKDYLLSLSTKKEGVTEKENV